MYRTPEQVDTVLAAMPTSRVSAELLPNGLVGVYSHVTQLYRLFEMTVSDDDYTARVTQITGYGQESDSIVAAKSCFAHAYPELAVR